MALKSLAFSIEDLGLEDRVVFGCDIGCSLLAWDFYNLDTIQTHHGRTVPVMVGLKIAKPELVAIAYMGDGGGYAIGLHHLITSVTRNDPVTVILINNTEYSMTGGQMAPTTLPGQKTETTPYGRSAEEGSLLKGAELVASIAGDGAYVARGTVADLRSLMRYFSRALSNQVKNNAFSFVEVLASCPTNWRTRPEETWHWVEEVMPQYFPPGEFKGGEEVGS